MSRIRTIKPTFWKDQKIGKLKREIRLMFIGLWNLADDEGVVNADASLIRSELFPYDEDLRNSSVQAWLDQLTKARMIIPFSYNGESYYLVRAFKAHQVINRPQDSKIPKEVLQNLVLTDSVNDPGTLTAGMEGKGREEERKGKDAHGRADFKAIELKIPFSEKFLETWLHWKNYKKKEHGFLFKSLESEQASINELIGLSGGREDEATQIIHQSMAKGWKGLFNLKTGNGQSTNSENGSLRDRVKKAADLRYGGGK